MVEEHAWRGAVWWGGACMAGGVHGGGVCMAGGGMLGGGQGTHIPPRGNDEIRSMSGRYVSYWNAFLLYV